MFILKLYKDMKKTAYMFLLVCLTLLSCSEDDSKLTYCGDSVVTGEVTDVTSTSAVINGYFSFYGEVNNFIGDVDYTELNDSVLVPKEELNSLIRVYFDIQDSIDVSNAPDSIMIYETPYDVQFIGAGYRISRYHDFRESELFLSADTKIRRYSSKVEGLTPSTTYYYKTVLAFRPVYVVDSPDINLYLTNAKIGDWFDYYVYGATKEFTTLP